MSLKDDKRRAREHALAVRSTCDPHAGAQLAAAFLRDVTPIPRLVAGFLPLAGEIDITPLLLELHARDHVVLLPVTPPRGQTLTFRPWNPGQDLLPGRFGTRHPDGPDMAPAMVLVPLLAFDRTGGRLGYGGGYYDRTLPGLAGAPRIGCAFARQEVTKVPTEPHDQRLDCVATENGVIDCRTAGKDE